MKKAGITSVQLLLLTVGSALMFPYTFMPILNTPPANQDAWLIAIFSSFYIVMISLPILILINKFRGFDIDEIAEAILGKFFGKIGLLLFAAFFIFCQIACMLIGASFIHISVLPGTPIWAILIFAFVPAAYGSYKGAGTIARLAVIIVSISIVTIVLFFLLGLSEMDIKVLLPILQDSTFSQINTGAFLSGARESEMLIFLIFSFFMAKKSNINKTFATGLGVFIVLHVMIIIPTISVLGLDMAKEVMNPYFKYTRQVNAYDFIQRVQSLNILAWFPGLLLKLMTYNFMFSHTLSKTFKTKSHKVFVIPTVVLAFIACMIPVMQKTSTITLISSDKVFPYIILPVTFVLPSILLVFYIIRRKKIDGMLKKREAEAALAGNNGSITPENTPINE